MTKENKDQPTTAKPKRRSGIYIVQTAMSVIHNGDPDSAAKPEFIDLQKFGSRSEADAWLAIHIKPDKKYRVVKQLGPVLALKEKTTSKIVGVDG